MRMRARFSTHLLMHHFTAADRIGFERIDCWNRLVLAKPGADRWVSVGS